MRDNALTLAVAALLAISASGVVAASMGTPAADSGSATALPANHSIDVVNPDEVSDQEIDQAIETAWANSEVQSYFDDGAGVHFQVWASELDDGIVHVTVAPIDAPDEMRVAVDTDPEREAVTSVTESVKLNASNATSFDLSAENVSIEGDESEPAGDDTSSSENATRITADQAIQLQFNESSIEYQEDGTFTGEVEPRNDTHSERSSRFDVSLDDWTAESR